MRPEFVVNRRAIIKWGAWGLAGLSGPQWGRADEAAAIRKAGEKTSSANRSAILFWLAGGPSHIDMYDMKPDAVAEIRGPFQPIQTNLSGLSVCELMPRHARIADRLAVVRSVTHEHSVHDDGSHWMQTGYPLLNARANGQKHPCEGSVVAWSQGAQSEHLPAYVCIPEDYQRHAGFYQTASFLGKKFDAYNTGQEAGDAHYLPPSFELPPAVTSGRLQSRRELLAQFDGWQRRLEEHPGFQDLNDVQQRAFALIGGSHVREACDLSRETDLTRARYGNNRWGRSALLARRLVEAGVTFVTINFYERDVDWWDDHYTIEANLRKRLPIYDQAYSTLIEDLTERGLLDRTLVASYGEFGRAPRIDSGAGRAHWPQAMSVVLAGGGLRTGQIVGSTTRDGSRPLDRPLTPGDLLATLYTQLGVDPSAAIPDRQGRPVPILPEGRPIRELCGLG